MPTSKPPAPEGRQDRFIAEPEQIVWHGKGPLKAGPWKPLPQPAKEPKK